MHFKKCGTCHSEKGFEHDDTDMMIRVACAMEFVVPSSHT